jgi:hypothetical protein
MGAISCAETVREVPTRSQMPSQIPSHQETRSAGLMVKEGLPRVRRKMTSRQKGGQLRTGRRSRLGRPRIPPFFTIPRGVTLGDGRDPHRCRPTETQLAALMSTTPDAAEAAEVATWQSSGTFLARGGTGCMNRQAAARERAQDVHPLARLDT